MSQKEPIFPVYRHELENNMFIINKEDGGVELANGVLIPGELTVAVSDVEYHDTTPVATVFVNLKNYNYTKAVSYFREQPVSSSSSSSSKVYLKFGDTYIAVASSSSDVYSLEEIVITDHVQLIGTKQATYNLALSLTQSYFRKDFTLTVTDTEDTTLASGVNLVDENTPVYIDVVLSVNDKVINVYPVLFNLNEANAVITYEQLTNAVPSLKTGDVVSVKLKDAFYFNKNKNADGKHEMYRIDGEQPVATYTIP